MADSHDDALPRARRRPRDASRADHPRETRGHHHAHGGWAGGGVSGFPGAEDDLRRQYTRARASEHDLQGRAERSVSVRFGKEIQEVLRRGDRELMEPTHVAWEGSQA